MKTQQKTFDHLKSDENVIGLMSNDLLAKIASGEIDYKRLAELTLAGRGCGRDGKWIGFKQAEKIFEIEEWL